MVKVIPDPRNERERTRAANGQRDGARFVNDPVGTISDAAGNVANSASNLASSASNTVSNAANNLTNGGGRGQANTIRTADAAAAGQNTEEGGMGWQGWVGGLLGVGGAWLLSSMFGGGWLGTIAFVLLAIPGFLMGRSALGGLFGGNSSSTRRTNGNAQSQGRGATQEQGAQNQNQEQAVQQANGQPYVGATQARTVDERIAMFNDQVEALHRIGQRQIQMEPRLTRRDRENINTNDQAMQNLQMQIANFHQPGMSAEEAQLLVPLLQQGERQLQQIYSRNNSNGHSLQADVQREVILMRRGTGRGPVFAGGDEQRTNAHMGARLDPRDLEAVEGIGRDRNYEPRPAQHEERGAPKFDRLPAQRDAEPFLNK